jgi:adhesin transport system outer membrane protein
MKNQSIFIFCFFTSLYAQDISIPNEIDLKTSIQFALKNHPQINEAQYQKEINVQRLKQGKSNYYPKLDSIYGYKKNFSQLRNETPLEKKQFYAGLEISQKVYDFGRTSDNVKILNENVEVATKILEQTKEEIAFKTISSYVNVLIQNYQLKVSEEKKNYYSKYRDFIKKQVEVGLKAPFELYNIETEYRNAEIEWIQSKNQSNLAKNQLLFYMGFEQTHHQQTYTQTHL